MLFTLCCSPFQNSSLARCADGQYGKACPSMQISLGADVVQPLQPHCPSNQPHGPAIGSCWCLSCCPVRPCHPSANCPWGSTESGVTLCLFPEKRSAVSLLDP